MAEKLYSMGDLIRRFGVARHTLVYLLDVNQIQPLRRVGTARLFDEVGAGQIERALRRAGRVIPDRGAQSDA